MVDFSIIVPVYNGSKYLNECIDSIIKQSYSSFELILVEDCSTDDSLEICKQYVELDSRIRLIEHDINRGLSNSRVDGLNESVAQWIIFLDNDDRMNPYLLEYYARYINCTDVDIVMGHSYYAFDEEATTYILPYEKNVEYNILTGRELAKDILDPKLRRCAIWGKAYRRVLFDKIDYKGNVQKDAPLCFFEDTFIVPQAVFFSQKVVMLSIYSVIYRLTANSTSKDNTNMEYTINQYNVGKYLMDFLKDNMLDFNYGIFLSSYALLIIKLWYFTSEKKETDYTLNKKVYYQDFCEIIIRVKNEGKASKLTYLNLEFFYLCPQLWGWTAGNLWFKILPRFQRLQQKIRSLRSNKYY